MTDFIFQKEVEQFIREKKILKKDFAAKIGITPVKFSHWLKGRVALPRRTLELVLSELEEQD